MTYQEATLIDLSDLNNSLKKARIVLCPARTHPDSFYPNMPYKVQFRVEGKGFRQFFECPAKAWEYAREMEFAEPETQAVACPPRMLEGFVSEATATANNWDPAWDSQGRTGGLRHKDL